MRSANKRRRFGHFIDMEFGVRCEPERGTDVVVGYRRVGGAFQLCGASVPVLSAPYAFGGDAPVLPLSQCLVQGSVRCLRGVRFPVLCDVFHERIENAPGAEGRCAACGAFGGERECAFCGGGAAGERFWRTENCERDRCDPLFVFVVVGNASDEFYRSLEEFRFRFVLMRYEKKSFTVLQRTGERMGFLNLFDAEIPVNAVLKMREGERIPHFPMSGKNGFKMDTVLEKIRPVVSSMQQFFNVVIVGNASHTCLTGKFDLPNASLSVLSSNTTRCKCCDDCQSSGGFYFPYAEGISIPGLCEVYSSSIRIGKKFIQMNDHCLLIRGFHLIFDQMQVFATTENTPVQIIIKTNSDIYCFTMTFKAKPGLKSFLYESSLPNMLTAFGANKESLKNLILQSMTKETITVPYSLRYFMHFPTITNRRTIHSVLSMRPFVVQFLPSLKVHEFVSQSLFSNISLLLVLYESTLYIYVGNDIQKETWEQELGVIPSSYNESFELKGIPDDFQSNLWTTIRSIRSMYIPYEVPIIVVPNESGRRVQLYEALSCDIVNGSNLIYQRFADLIHSKI